jgi:hypothetical protein
MADVDAALQSQVRNIEATYGKNMPEWFTVIDHSGLTKHNEVVAMLKSEHGLAHAAAHRISLLARDRLTTATTTNSVSAAVDSLYAGRKSSLRPLHDQLMSAIHTFGDFEVAPKKGYLSLRRRKQFAMIQPSTATRIDVGLNLPAGTPCTEWLESAAKFNALFSHRVRVTSADDISPKLLRALRNAYDAAGERSPAT